MKQVREVVDEVMTPSPRLIVRQPDPTHVTFVDADGHSRTFTATGKKEQHQLTAGTVHTKTQWEGGELILLISVDHGPTIVETWAVPPGTRRLVLTMKRDDSRDKNAAVRTLTYDEASLQ